MRAAYARAPFDVQIREVDVPIIDDDEAMIRVGACGVCGFDLQLVSEMASDYVEIGHEVAGEIVQVGRYVTGFSSGDRVAVQTVAYCGTCHKCKDGRVALCQQRFRAFGRAGFADFMVVPKQCLYQADGIPLERAAMAEPLSIAIDAVLTAAVEFNHSLAVLGVGPLGLMCTWMARQLGVRRLYALGPSRGRRRLELAVEMGADEALAIDQVDVEEFFRLAEASGVDRIIVTAPPSSLPLAVSLAAYGGIIAFIGVGHGETQHVTLDMNAVHFKKLQIRGAHNSPNLHFATAIDLIRSGRIDIEKLISHRFPLDDISAAFRVRFEQPEEVVKMMITP